MLTLKKFPDPVLREKMPDFEFNNPIMDPLALEKNMIELMFNHEGIGLSANQVGVKARVFTMGHKSSTKDAIALFNPIILDVHDDIIDIEEGCLSFPNIFVKVKRPAAVYARWQNSAGEWQQGEFNGYDCKCFLHEFDHLEGITFKDRVSTLKWNMATKRGKK